MRPDPPAQRCFVSELAISGRSAVCFAKLDSQGLEGENRDMQTRASSIYPATNKAGSSAPSYTLGPVDHGALRKESLPTNFCGTPTLCQAALLQGFPGQHQSTTCTSAILRYHLFIDKQIAAGHLRCPGPLPPLLFPSHFKTCHAEGPARSPENYDLGSPGTVPWPQHFWRSIKNVSLKAEGGKVYAEENVLLHISFFHW